MPCVFRAHSDWQNQYQHPVGHIVKLDSSTIHSGCITPKLAIANELGLHFLSSNADRRTALLQLLETRAALSS